MQLLLERQYGTKFQTCIAGSECVWSHGTTKTCPGAFRRILFWDRTLSAERNITLAIWANMAPGWLLYGPLDLYSSASSSSRLYNQRGYEPPPRCSQNLHRGSKISQWLGESEYIRTSRSAHRKWRPARQDLQALERAGEVSTWSRNPINNPINSLELSTLFSLTLF